MKSLIEDFEKISKIELPTKDGYKIQKIWLEIFAAPVKAATGKFFYKGYAWHSFTYNFYPAVYAQKALNKYMQQELEPYYVFVGNGSTCWECESEGFPDFSKNTSGEMYILPKSKRWTMVFCHEYPIFAFNHET